MGWLDILLLLPIAAWLIYVLGRLRRTLRQMQKVKIRACQKTGPYFLFQ